MIIATASGKGGTGKTTVATSLARTLARDGHPVDLLDCDVEEPNCHIFLTQLTDATQLEWQSSTTVAVPVPRIDLEKCDFCGTCADVCEFNAIACLADKVLVAAELCHGCGGCMLLCPKDAISEIGREVGVVRHGRAGRIRFVEGRLRVGEAMAVPLINAVKQAASSNDIVLIDAPPGTSCPVITAVKGVDFVLLVTEPTPFGLNDLQLAVDTVRQLGLPFAVVLNRSDVGDQAVAEYCRRERIDILLEIPNDRRVAEAYSRGTTAADVSEEYEARFRKLFESVRRRVSQGGQA